MQAETTIYFVVWWALFECSSFDHFPEIHFVVKFSLFSLIETASNNNRRKDGVVNIN